MWISSFSSEVCLSVQYSTSVGLLCQVTYVGLGTLLVSFLFMRRTLSVENEL